MVDTEKNAKTMTGSVISSKMEKSATVVVQRTVKHPLYEKYLRRSTKFVIHDENNECSEGDIVVIEATRPISKRKTWKLNKIIEKAQKV